MQNREPTALPNQNFKRRFQLVGFIATLATALLAAWALGFGTESFGVRLRAALATLGPWAPVAFVGVKVASVILALPSSPVGLAGGALFGPVWGTVLNVLAGTAGASATFFLGRHLGREEVEARLGGRLRDLDARLADNGFQVMLFLRLVPLFPFNVVNYASGLTRIRFRDYFWGTAIGIVPGAAVFTYLGHAAAEASPTRFLVGLALLGALALLPLVWKRRDP